jgi:hypothetical protein
MNGFGLLEPSDLRKYLEMHPETPDHTRQAMERQIKVQEAMSGLDKRDLSVAFDMGVFNDICVGYVQEAMSQTDISPKKQEEVISNLKSLFDSKAASEIVA